VCLWLGENNVILSMVKQEHSNLNVPGMGAHQYHTSKSCMAYNVLQFPDKKTWLVDSEATLIGSIIHVKSDSTFHIKTWYPNTKYILQKP
jgi:hypothetical protein